MSRGSPSTETALAEVSSVVTVAAPATPTRVGLTVGLWIRVGLALVLLTASAAARQWQSRRVNEALRSGRVAPFPLNEIPESLGDWEGIPAKMDPHISRATGATDSIVRSYQHRRTGQRIDLILLFGPSTEMYIHTPENCYPAAGYSLMSGPFRHSVPSNGTGTRIPFASLVYVQGEGSTVERREVYYTWHYSGQWTPNLVTQKRYERIPGMFKVHVDRIVKEKELDLLDVGNPCEAFLAMLMPEIDSRLARAQGQPPTPVKP